MYVHKRKLQAIILLAVQLLHTHIRNILQVHIPSVKSACSRVQLIQRECAAIFSRCTLTYVPRVQFVLYMEAYTRVGHSSCG